MKFNQSISFEEVRDLFVYKYRHGKLVWKRTAKGRTRNQEAGSLSTRDGYRRVVINRKSYAVHRLIWLYDTGKWPEGFIDHINGKRDDNRLVNLRDVTATINNRNQTVLSKRNMSGYKGISWCKHTKKWVAQITVNNNVLKLGRYKDINDAINARAEAEDLHWGSER